MAADLPTQLLTLQAGRFQQAAQIMMLRKANQMDMMVADMLAQSARAAPAPAGQGLVVDKQARAASGAPTGVRTASPQ